ncbi:MAG: hypothetical protein LKF31_09010 [Muribaculaceae bacterium]|jgi:hypothetical protein|nr:hypothetical protein [Muribaculaceae bacterium]
MKLLISKILILFFAMFSVAASAAEPDSTVYTRHVERYRSLWDKLIPTYYKIQYAGSMGLISAGVGWNYGHHHQWETDLFFGYVPKYDSRDNKLTFTLKENYIPWTIHLGKRYSFDPFTVSLYFNSILSGKYWTHTPSRYPGGYYFFSTRIRTNLAIGQRVTLYVPRERRKYATAITAFYELGTNDFYVISAVDNHYLNLRDILHLSLGVKFSFF